MTDHIHTPPEQTGTILHDAVVTEMFDIIGQLQLDPTNDLLRRKYLYLRYVRDGAWCARNPDELAQQAIDNALGQRS